MVEVVFKDKAQVKPVHVFSLDDIEEKNKETKGEENSKDISPLEDTPQQNEDEHISEDQSVSDTAEPIENEASEEAPQEPIKKKSKKLPSQRIRQVLHQKKAFENAAYSLLEENKALKKHLEHKDRLYYTTREHALKVQADVAQKAYEKAVDDGDSQAQAETQRYLIQIENELKDHTRKLKENPNSYYVNEDIRDYMVNTPPPEPYEEFILENEWVDQNSPYFNPYKFELAKEIEQQMLFNMQEEGLMHLRDTKEYFDTLSDVVEKEYQKMRNVSEMEEDSYPEQESDSYYESPPKRSASKVAPVNRANTAQSYSKTPSGTIRVQLNDEEKEYALSLDYGKPLTDGEKIERFTNIKKQRIEKERQKGRN